MDYVKYVLVATIMLAVAHFAVIIRNSLDLRR